MESRGSWRIGPPIRGMSTPGSAREGSGGRREMTPSAATDPTELAATALASSASIDGADAPLIGTLKA